MAFVAQRYQDQLDEKKANVEFSKKSFAANIARFHNCRSFVFKTALSMNDKGIAQELQRPELEVNILETYISHLLGEFSKQTPSPFIQPVNQNPALANQALVVEGHIRSIFESSIPVQINTLRNTLSGGYSVIKICTEYVSEKSFDQKICLRSVLDDTQTGFDPMAKESHKGDGRYCYELIPKTKEDLEEEFPGIDLSDISWDNQLSEGFEWYFREVNGNEEKKIAVICSYFEKKMTYKMLYRVSDPSHPDNSLVMTKEQYEELLSHYATSGIMTAPPVVLEKSKRPSTTIVHYQFTGDEVLSYEETDYMFLPLVFIDGNSVVLKEGQMTRPYIYNAMDAQRMKNVCAQSIMNDVENMRQTDIFIAKEAIPKEPEFKLGWMNPQKANAALVYNYFSETNDSGPLPMPQVFPRQQVSPVVMQMYQVSDQSVQSVLGSYDAQQGLQSDMSGVAIENGAMQSNNAAKPYITNYLIGMNQVCKIIVDLMPKYYTTLRTIPIVSSEGKRSYKVINDTVKDPLFKIEYEINDLEVDVKMDQNFEVQKSRFIQTVTQLMKVSPILNQFFSTDGVPLILDNVTIKDIAKVKEQYAQFLQKQQAQQQQQQQMQMQMNPAVIQKQIADIKAQSDEKDRHVDLIEMFLTKRTEDRKAETADAASQAKVLDSQGKLAIAAMNADAENKRSQIDAAIALDRHFNEKVQSEREHLLNTIELGANIHANEIKQQEAREARKAGSQTGSDVG